MGDIFLRQNVEHLLYNKFVVIIGDSIQRAVYKDLVLLLQKNRYLTDNNLRNKGEMSFEKDELIEGGKKGKMTNGINYREVRQYLSDYNLLRFYFVCRCYNSYMESILADLSEEPRPDVVILNSCLWDISRYGPTAIDEYKENLKTLFRRFKELLPADCLVIWNTTLPISKNARGGFLIPEIEFMNSTLRLDILEANYYAAKVVVENGFDVLDLHFYLRYQLHRRADDGIHWDMTAHRRMTNLLLTHISDAWGFPLPGNVKHNQNKDPEEFRFGNNTRRPQSLLGRPQSLLGRPQSLLNQPQSLPNRPQSFRTVQMVGSQNMKCNVQMSSDPYIEQMMQIVNPNNIAQFHSNTRRNIQMDCGYGIEMNNCNFGGNNCSNDNFQWQPYCNNNFNAVRSHQMRPMDRNRYQPYKEQQRRRLRRQ